MHVDLLRMSEDETHTPQNMICLQKPNTNREKKRKNKE